MKILCYLIQPKFYTFVLFFPSRTKIAFVFHSKMSSSTGSSDWDIIVIKRNTTKSISRNPLVCNSICQYVRFGRTPNRGFVHCNNPWNIGNETPRLKPLARRRREKYIFCNNEIFPFGLYVVPVLIFFSTDSHSFARQTQLLL